MPFKTLSPVGRIVQGNPLFASPVKDDNDKPKLNDDGTPKVNWWLNVAFSKQDPATATLIQQIMTEAASTFPQLFPNGYRPDMLNFGCVRPDFASKLVDGDGVDLNGKPHANKEGWAGHWILKISTYAGQIRCYDGLNNNAIITEQEAIHTGKYVRVSLDVKGNGWSGQGNSKPGLFVNPDGVQLVGHGPKITSGPDAATMFAQPVAAGYIPPGMSTTPVASVAMPGTPQPMAMPTTQQPIAPQAMPHAPQMAAPVMPAAQPAPAPQPMVMPQMQVAQPNPQFTQAAVTPTYTMTERAQGYSREQWHGAGQTDESLVAAGMMIIS